MQLLFMLRDHVLLLPFLFTLLRQRENKMHLDYGTMTEKETEKKESKRGENKRKDKRKNKRRN